MLRCRAPPAFIRPHRWSSSAHFKEFCLTLEAHCCFWAFCWGAVIRLRGKSLLYFSACTSNLTARYKTSSVWFPISPEDIASSDLLSLCWQIAHEPFCPPLPYNRKTMLRVFFFSRWDIYCGSAECPPSAFLPPSPLWQITWESSA